MVRVGTTERAPGGHEGLATRYLGQGMATCKVHKPGVCTQGALMTSEEADGLGRVSETDKK